MAGELLPTASQPPLPRLLPSAGLIPLLPPWACRPVAQWAQTHQEGATRPTGPRAATHIHLSSSPQFGRPTPLLLLQSIRPNPQMPNAFSKRRDLSDPQMGKYNCACGWHPGDKREGCGLVPIPSPPQAQDRLEGACPRSASAGSL